MPRPRNRNLRVGLGVAAIALYVIRVAAEAPTGSADDAMWACHLGTLAVGLGLLADRPALNGVGLMWLLLGVPLWLVDLATNGCCVEITSPLSHLGGFALGLAGAKVLGLPKGVWWKAGAGLCLLHWASRWITREEENVNLAFRVWPGWEPYFPSHAAYILSIGVLACLLFAGAEFALRRSGLAAEGRKINDV